MLQVTPPGTPPVKFGRNVLVHLNYPFNFKLEKDAHKIIHDSILGIYKSCICDLYVKSIVVTIDDDNGYTDVILKQFELENYNKDLVEYNDEKFKIYQCYLDSMQCIIIVNYTSNYPNWKDNIMEYISQSPPPPPQLQLQSPPLQLQLQSPTFSFTGYQFKKLYKYIPNNYVYIDPYLNIVDPKCIKLLLDTLNNDNVQVVSCEGGVDYIYQNVLSRYEKVYHNVLDHFRKSKDYSHNNNSIYAQDLHTQKNEKNHVQLHKHIGTSYKKNLSNMWSFDYPTKMLTISSSLLYTCLTISNYNYIYTLVWTGIIILFVSLVYFCSSRNVNLILFYIYSICRYILEPIIYLVILVGKSTVVGNVNVNGSGSGSNTEQEKVNHDVEVENQSNKCNSQYSLDVFEYYQNQRDSDNDSYITHVKDDNFYMKRKFELPLKFKGVESDDGDDDEQVVLTRLEMGN